MGWEGGWGFMKKIGGNCLKRGLEHFPDLSGGAWQERGWCL